MQITQYSIETNSAYLSAFTVAKRRIFPLELASITLYDYEMTDEGYILHFAASPDFETITPKALKGLTNYMQRAAKIAHHEGIPMFIKTVKISTSNKWEEVKQVLENQKPEHVSITNLFKYQASQI